MSDKRIASPHTEEHRPKTEENAIRSGYYIMTSGDVYRYAALVLERHLRWRDYGPKCTVNTLLQVLLYAAAQLCSVFAACCQCRMSRGLITCRLRRMHFGDTMAEMLHEPSDTLE